MKIIRYLLILIVFLAVVLFFTFDMITKKILSDYLGDTLQTTVTVGSVKSSFSDKSIKLSTLEVQNPVNFDSKNALSIGLFSFNLSDKDYDDTIIVENLSFNNINATLEQNSEGINLKMLSDNLSKVPSNTSSASKNDHDSDDNGKKIIIENFSITNSKITINTKFLKETISIPDIYIKDIGGKNGINASNIGPYVMNILLTKLQEAVTKKGLDMAKDKLKKSLTRKISEKLGLESDTIDNLKNSTGESLNNLKDKASDVFKGLF